MEIAFRLPIDGSPDLTLVQSPWTGRSRLFVEGAEIPAERRGRARYFVVPLGDGAKVEMQLKNSGIDVLPRAAIVQGDPPVATPVPLARALAWWEYVLCALPLLLIPVGGALGGVIGAMAAYVNLRLMRTDLSPPLRVLAALGVLVGASVVFVIVAVAISLAFGGR